MSIKGTGGPQRPVSTDNTTSTAEARPTAAAPPPASTTPAPAAGVSAPPPPPPTEAQRQDNRAALSAGSGTAAALWASKMGGSAAAAASAPVDGTKAPPLPEGTRDVSQVTPEEIKALQASKDPKEVRMGNTIANAQVAYADRIKDGARVLVNTSAGNDGQPVLTLIPKGFDYTKPARVDTHYHGWNSTVADPPGHGSGTTVRMKEIQEHDPQTVFVLPECSNSPKDASLKSGTDYHTQWNNVNSQAQTTDDALKAAGITQVGTTVVSAHSGGGAALQHAMEAHKDGSGVKADRLELQDCLYGSEGAIAGWAKTQNGKDCKSVVYLHGTNDHSPAGIKSAFGSRYQLVDMAKQGPINDQNNPPLVDGDGKPVLGPDKKQRHHFHADAHNRTVGQFMDFIPGP